MRRFAKGFRCMPKAGRPGSPHRLAPVSSWNAGIRLQADGVGKNTLCGRRRGRGACCMHVRAAEDDASGIRRLRVGRRAAIGRIDAVVCRNRCAGGVIKMGRAPWAGRGCGSTAAGCAEGLVSRLGLDRLRTPAAIAGAAPACTSTAGRAAARPGRPACSGAPSPPMQPGCGPQGTPRRQGVPDSNRPRLSGRRRIG